MAADPPQVGDDRPKEPTTIVLAGVATAAAWALRLIVLSAAALALVWVLGQLWVVVLPVLLALLLTSVLWPPARLLRRFLPDAAAALVVVTGAVLVLAGVVAFLVPRVIDQAQPLTQRFIAGVEDLQDVVVGSTDLGQDELAAALDTLVDELQTNAQVIAIQVISGITVVGSAVITAVLALVLTFFFLKDGPRFLPWASRALGPRAGVHLQALAARVWLTLGGFIRSQAIVGLVDATFIGIGLVLLDVPLPLTLSVLIFFAAFIPIVGAVATGALAALVALVDQGPTIALVVVVLVLVVQQVESNVLQPFVVGHALSLHPAVVLLAVTAGASLRGIVGAFLAVPVVAAAAVVLRYIGEAASSSGPGVGLAPKPGPVRPAGSDRAEGG